MAKKYVSWRRVSTKKQGKSGLGLEAQKEIIRYFIERENGDWIADYEECYTGTELSGCVELRKAMERAKKDGAILIIAKSDRFRNTIEALQVYEEMGDGNIMFCDLPHTDKFTLTLFFALAEREALIVSIRTKQALAAKKSRGEALGGSSDKWRETYNAMPKDERKKVNMKRGASKNSRYLESKDVTTFLRVLKKTFPCACENEEAAMWDWSQINTKGENKVKIISYMRDFKEIDGSGKLFVKWDFTQTQESLRVKVASFIQHTRRALTYKTREAELTNTYINN